MSVSEHLGQSNAVVSLIRRTRNGNINPAVNDGLTIFFIPKTHIKSELLTRTFFPTSSPSHPPRPGPPRLRRGGPGPHLSIYSLTLTPTISPSLDHGAPRTPLSRPGAALAASFPFLPLRSTPFHFPPATPLPLSHSSTPLHPQHSPGKSQADLGFLPLANPRGGHSHPSFAGSPRPGPSPRHPAPPSPSPKKTPLISPLHLLARPATHPHPASVSSLKHIKSLQLSTVHSTSSLNP